MTTSSVVAAALFVAAAGASAQPVGCEGKPTQTGTNGGDGDDVLKGNGGP